MIHVWFACRRLVFSCRYKFIIHRAFQLEGFFSICCLLMMYHQILRRLCFWKPTGQAYVYPMQIHSLPPRQFKRSSKSLQKPVSWFTFSAANWLWLESKPPMFFCHRHIHTNIHHDTTKKQYTINVFLIVWATRRKNGAYLLARGLNQNLRKPDPWNGVIFEDGTVRRWMVKWSWSRSTAIVYIR